jgi:hypothetical protein
MLANLSWRYLQERAEKIPGDKKHVENMLSQSHCVAQFNTAHKLPSSGPLGPGKSPNRTNKVLLHMMSGKRVWTCGSHFALDERRAPQNQVRLAGCLWFCNASVSIHANVSRQFRREGPWQVFLRELESSSR